MGLSKKEIKEVIDLKAKSNKQIAIDLRDDILNDLPSWCSTFINEAFVHKRVPKEYLLTSINFAVTIAIGKTPYTHIGGYKNFTNNYFLILGSRGDKKSEAINSACKPITDLDNDMYEEYVHAMKRKDDDEEPIRNRHLINDATPEALTKEHFNNKKGIGCLYDEMHDILSQIGDPKSPRGQKHKDAFISGWNNNVIDVSRVTSDSYRINEPFISVIGGLQVELLSKLFKGGLLESGLIDRFLPVNLLEPNYKLSDKQLNHEIDKNYLNQINKIIDFSSKHKEDQIQIEYEDPALQRLKEYKQDMLYEKQKESGELKSYLSKLQIHFERLTLLFHILKNTENSSFKSKIQLPTVELAIKAIKFYRINFLMMLEKLYLPTINDIDLLKYGIKNGANNKEIASVMGYQPPWIGKLRKKHDI